MPMAHEKGDGDVWVGGKVGGLGFGILEMLVWIIMGDEWLIILDARDQQKEIPRTLNSLRLSKRIHRNLSSPY